GSSRAASPCSSFSSTLSLRTVWPWIWGAVICLALPSGEFSTLLRRIRYSSQFPRYSPRLLDVRVVKSIGSYERDRLDRRPRNRNYRYQWWYYKRHMYSEGYQVRWQAIPQKFGVMSLEPRLGRELALLRRRYNMMRLEAGLPPYVWAGPYQIHQRMSREGKAEQNRRQLLYAYDERRKRALKKKLQRMKVKWGVYKIDKEPRVPAVDRLMAYHPLTPHNLPK
ncbi:hypothetical protein FOZ62_013729, partial [Perkinsus olseni]